MARIEHGKSLLVSQLSIDLQTRLRASDAFTPIGRMQRDWVLSAVVVLGTMLAVVGVLSAASTPLFSRPSHMVAVVGAAIAGAVIGNFARRDLRRHGFEQLGVDGASLLLVSRDRVRVIPAERLEVATVGEQTKLSIGGREIAQVPASDAVTRMIEEAIERARDPDHVARDRWRMAPAGLPSIDSTWAPVLVGGFVAIALTLGASAALAPRAPVGVSWDDVADELVKFERTDREMRVNAIASDARLSHLMALHQRDRETANRSAWFDRDESTILEATRARIAGQVASMKRAQTYEELRDRWSRITSLRESLVGVVDGMYVRQLQTEQKDLEPAYTQRAQELVDGALTAAKGLFDDGERLVLLQQTYSEARRFRLETDAIQQQVRSTIDQRMTVVAGDVDKLLALADVSSGFMDEAQRQRLWNSLSVHIPKATRLQQLSDIANYEETRDERVDVLMRRARSLLGEHIRDMHRHVEGATAMADILGWDQDTVDKHATSVMREAIDHAVSVGIPIREIANRLVTPVEIALLAEAVDQYREDESEIVRAIANERANRETVLEKQLAWADAARESGETVEAWQCARMYRRPAQVPVAQQQFYRQLAIELCENEATELFVGGDDGDPEDVEIARSLAIKLHAYRRVTGREDRSLEAKIVDRFSYTHATIERTDRQCRVELDDSDVSISCGGLR